jgi:hypothetical protein
MWCVSKSDFIDFYNNVILKTLASNDVVIVKCDDLLSAWVRIALSKLSEAELVELVNLLNKISNHDILSINNETMTYTTVAAKDTAIDSMQILEKVYLVSFLSSKNLIKAFIYEDVLGLDEKALQQYIEMFRDTDIVIVVEAETLCAYYRKLILSGCNDFELSSIFS